MPLSMNHIMVARNNTEKIDIAITFLKLEPILVHLIYSEYVYIKWYVQLKVWAI